MRQPRTLCCWFAMGEHTEDEQLLPGEGHHVAFARATPSPRRSDSRSHRVRAPKLSKDGRRGMMMMMMMTTERTMSSCAWGEEKWRRRDEYPEAFGVPIWRVEDMHGMTN